ncbi:CUB domain-containing protein 2-like [Parasteatoda tepidariorum]|uniref:CUB domain-containing protein 2-like n=1 Tax=Parasteatoda tepidariorum TaxID=114398 RepID=UPI00077FD890|nr:CUB and zona pellucida-like domain-containing protein 1 [Parasteatoda tepidariorum]
MAHLNYFLHILGMIFLQMCLVYSSCKNVKELKGTISNSYTVRGGSLYHRCWTLKNPDKNVIFIQLNNISLHNRPASKGVLTMKFLSDSKTVNVSSESQLGNFTTTSSVVEIHFKVNSAHFTSGQKTSFSLYFSQDCNRILTELTGNLSSPHYPSSSPTDAQCIYRIRLTPGYLINITFQNIDIGLDDTCDKGNLQVYDGDDQESPLAAELCGVIASYPIISTNNYLWIKFKSYWLFGSSFSANYSAVKIFEMPTNIDEPEEVSEVITDNSEGNFQTSTTEDNLESRSNAQEECKCPTGTTDLTMKDVLKMEVKEHHCRSEVIKLQENVLELQKTVLELQKKVLGHQKRYIDLLEDKIASRS